jgi:hypothetical protein
MSFRQKFIQKFDKVECQTMISENPDAMNSWFYPIDPDEAISLQDICTQHEQLMAENSVQEVMSKSNMLTLSIFFEAMEEESYQICIDQEI